MSSPHSCGFPDETNTGWRHTGVNLKRVQTDPFYITEEGTVIDGLDIEGCVVVRAKNVTIRRSRITCASQPAVKNFEPDGRGNLVDIGAGLVLEDVELDGEGDDTAHGVGFNHYTARRVHFHDLGAAAKLGTNVLIEDSYVHEVATAPDAHVGGFPSDGGSGIVVRHNTVLMNSDNGYAVALYNQVPPGAVVADVVLEDNLLAGGNYVLYCGSPDEITPDLRVTGNRVSNIFHPRGGFYGAGANCRGAAQWRDNSWDHSGEALDP